MASRWGTVSAALLLSASLVVAPPASALDASRSIKQMQHRSYTQEDGLPGGLTAIGQTPDGYIWIGTGRGLFRFDGVRFEPFAADKLLSPAVSALRATPGGDLWIGYVSGGLSRLRDGRIEHFTSENGGPAGAGVDAIKVSPDGEEVWAVVSLRVWRRSAGVWRQPLGRTQMWAIEQARDGVTWLKNGDTLFYCRPRGAPCIPAPGYVGGVMGFVRNRDGRVWTSDANAPGRMYRLPDVVGLPDAAIPRPEYGATISPRIRGRMLLDRDGTLWNINFKNGLLRTRSILDGQADTGVLDAFTAEDGLTHDLAERLFEDREGNIWVSTKAGLDQFRPANVVLERAIPTDVNGYGYFAAPVGDALYVNASTSDDNSNPFGGAAGPLFRISADGAVEPVVADMPVANALARTDDGLLWASSLAGLFRIEGRRAVAADMPPGAESSTVVSVIARPGGLLWAWVWAHGAWERSNGVWRQHPTMPGRDELGGVEFARLGRDGAVWLARSDPFTLIRHHNSSLQRFTVAEVKIGPVRALSATDRVEYFGGQRGIALFDGARFHALGVDRVPALTDVTGVAEVGPDLWVVSSSGILRFDRRQVERAMHDPRAPAPGYERFDQLDGLPAAADLSAQSAIPNTIFPRPDGRIVFVTGAGIVWIDPRNIARNALPPPVAIQSLATGGRVYEARNGVALPAGSASLQIDFTALSFTEPSRVRFRYRLAGVDKDWVDPGARRQAYYTRLGPGTYTFRVIAANDAGVWNREGATVTFAIAPTFLQSIWFKLLLVFALMALAWAIYAFRLRQETARLQSRFEVRTAERERIARELHDTLLQSVQALTLRFQLAVDDLPKKARARRALEAAIDQADQAIAEGRDRVRDLRSVDNRGDIEAVLRETLKQQGFDPAVDVSITTTGESRTLDPVALDEIARIASEAIFNIRRHAQASAVEIEVGYDAGFSLRIMDNGVGIGDEIAQGGGREGHFGLAGMRERARKLRGKLVVEHRPQGGCKVLLTVPGSVAYKTGGRWRLFRAWSIGR